MVTVCVAGGRGLGGGGGKRNRGRKQNGLSAVYLKGLLHTRDYCIWRLPEQTTLSAKQLGLNGTCESNI